MIIAAYVFTFITQRDKQGNTISRILQNYYSTNLSEDNEHIVKVVDLNQLFKRTNHLPIV